MANLTTGRIPKALSATVIGDSAFEDTGAGLRVTANGEGVVPASSTPAGFAITSNYAGYGEVDFWNLVNNEDTNNEGFVFRQKTGAGTSKNIANLYSTSTFTEFDVGHEGAGTVSFYVDIAERAIYATSAVPLNLYVNSSILALSLASDGRFILPVSVTPASATAVGVAGTIAWDASYVYVCTATNTWKRVAIATW